MADVLLLCCDAPLQSWGLRARWDVRDSADEPTKSGVIGLLGCALGYPVGDERLEQLDQVLHMGVRVENPGSKLIDFQTVLGVMRTAAGGVKGKPDDPNTIVSPREYVQDAIFLVGLEGPRTILEECASALKSPRWPVYFGRKACVPSRPVFQELTERYDSLEQALTLYPWLGRSLTGEPPQRLKCVIEDDMGDHIRPDRIRTNRARMYQQRTVSIKWVPTPGISQSA